MNQVKKKEKHHRALRAQSKSQISKLFPGKKLKNRRHVAVCKNQETSGNNITLHFYYNL